MIGLRHARMVRRKGGRPFCAAGIKAWCDRHEIDWKAFTGPGVTEERMLQINDHYAQVLINLAREEQENGRQ